MAGSSSSTAPATPPSCCFKDELKEWAERDDVELHVTVDRADDEWTGNVGVITTLFSKISVYPRNTVAITIGPPVMYRFVLMELLGKGIPETQHLAFTGTADEVWRRQMRPLPDQRPLYLPVRPFFSYAEIKAVEGRL